MRTRWYLVAGLAALVGLPGAVGAQRLEMLPTGTIGPVEDRSPTTWAMSGFDIIHLTRSDGAFTPIMRTLRMDARTVEILTRTQAPRLTGGDIRTVVQDGRSYVAVRRYLLAEVRPQDASAKGMSVASLANEWTRSVRSVLPQVAPMSNRFGI